MVLFDVHRLSFAVAPILVIYQIWLGARKRLTFGQVQISPRHMTFTILTRSY